jgi:hypothetical protein
LLLHLVEVAAQGIEASLPGAATVVGPGAHLGERGRIHLVDPVLAVCSNTDKACLPQETKVARDSGLADGEEVDELAVWSFSANASTVR